MPQIPYSGTQEVAPQDRPLANVHVDTPVAAFGGAVAGAITHMGEVAEGAGKELFARAYAMQELNEQVKADAASADTFDRQTQRYLKFDELKGQERIDGFPQYQNDLRQIREDGAAGLDSPYAKQKYLSDTRRNESSMIWHGGVLARQGQDEATKQASLAKIDARGNALATLNITDGPEFDQAVAGIKSDAANLVHEQFGFAPGTKDNDDLAGRYLSGQVAKVAIARSHNNPGDGQAFAEKMRDNGMLHPEDYDRISNQLESAVNNRGTADVARKVVNENPKATAAELDDAARKEAAKKFPNNPTAADTAATKTLQLTNLHETVTNKANLDLRTSVIQAIDGVTSKDGKVPTSMDEVQQNDPATYAKYLKLDPQSQATVNEVILRNQKVGGVVHNQIGDDEYYRLSQIGINRDSTSTPEQLDELTNADLLKGKLASLTRDQRQGLMKIQADVNKGLAQNPNMSHALHLAPVEQALRDAGIDAKSNPDEYNKFQTTYHDAIVNYGLGAERSIKNDETLTNIATGLINKQAGSWFPWARGINTKQPYAGLAEFSPQAKKVGTSAFMKVYQRSPDPTSETDMNLVNRLALQAIYQGFGRSSKGAAKDTGP